MKTTKMLLMGAATLLAIPAAYGEGRYAWNEPTLYSAIGIGLDVGGGVGGFTSQTLRDTVDTRSSLWTARATVGTHIPVGVDVTYVGTQVDIRPRAGMQSGNLLGTAVEGALRWNVLPHSIVNPYAFAGIGWQRYDVRNASLTRANGVMNEDNLVDFPLGVGVAYRDSSGIVVDVHGTFRAAQSSSLVLDSAGNNADLHTWEASGSLGYEF